MAEMNRGDGNRNRKEQQIGDQPGTPLVRCLVLVAKILNLRETNKTHGGSTGAEQAACSTGARTQGRAAQGTCMQEERSRHARQATAAGSRLAGRHRARWAAAAWEDAHAGGKRARARAGGSLKVLSARNQGGSGVYIGMERGFLACVPRE